MRLPSKSAALSILPALLSVAMLCAGSQSVSRTAGEQPANRYGLSRPLPRTKGAIRIATYNVLNLFDHVDDPNLSGEHDDLPMATDDDRCRGIAAAIRAVDADIIALQEVESLECLTWFRDTYLADMGYEYMASHDAGYYRGVEQSVLSRFPITSSKVWPHASIANMKRTGPGWSEPPAGTDEPLELQRSPLRVDIKVREDYELTIFALHHKSGPYRWKRELEALKTLQYIDEVRGQDPARNIIVMGDFNAAPWDKSLRLYLQAGFIDTLAHRVIPRWKEFDPAEPNLYKTHESDRVIDYILLNSAAHREFVIGSAHVYGTLFDPDYDWKTDPFPEGYASDHYPLIIDLVPRDQL
ncbi:MAG: endonuclease/exonuclease/phosphatase family protein [Phycisphaerales bacterium]|nr:MAG: endonuclease/exonuclease/phosphatase family protein [Phycisphaerales bacterium]